MQVTGSHNPRDYNGFKMVLAGRAIYGDDIQRLRRSMEQRDWRARAGGRVRALDRSPHAAYRLRRFASAAIAAGLGGCRFRQFARHADLQRRSRRRGCALLCCAAVFSGPSRTVVAGTKRLRGSAVAPADLMPGGGSLLFSSGSMRMVAPVSEDAEHRKLVADTAVPKKRAAERTEKRQPRAAQAKSQATRRAYNPPPVTLVEAQRQFLLLVLAVLALDDETVDVQAQAGIFHSDLVSASATPSKSGPQGI